MYLGVLMYLYSFAVLLNFIKKYDMIRTPIVGSLTRYVLIYFNFHKIRTYLSPFRLLTSKRCWYGLEKILKTRRVMPQLLLS